MTNWKQSAVELLEAYRADPDTKYIRLYATEDQSQILEQEVNILLRAGWQLAGGIAVGPQGGVYQALWRV